MVSYPCCTNWLNPVCAFEKLFTGTLLTCRSDLKQQVLTTGFPPTLMPLRFAGFGHCFWLPALRRSPQHIEPSCDFCRCVGSHAVGFSSYFNFFTNVSVLARCKLTVAVVSWDHNCMGQLTSYPLRGFPLTRKAAIVGVWRRPVADIVKCLLHTTCYRRNIGFC